jgi:hypothetical protein
MELVIGRKDIAAYRGSRARKGHHLPGRLKPTGIS